MAEQTATDVRHRLVALVPLAVSVVYSLAVLSVDALNFEHHLDVALSGVAVATWLILFILFTRLLFVSDDRGRTVRENLAYPLLLLSPLLLWPNTSWALMLVLVVSYVLQLRSVAAGDAFAFSFGLVLFIAFVTSVGMVVVEQDQPDSPLHDWPTALTWSIASLLHLGDSAVGHPLSDDGRTLSLVVGVCAVLATGLLTAQLVKWVSGVDERKGDTARGSDGPLTQSGDVAAELARLQAAVAELTDRIQSTSLADSGDCEKT